MHYYPTVPPPVVAEPTTCRPRAYRRTGSKQSSPDFGGIDVGFQIITSHVLQLNDGRVQASLSIADKLIMSYKDSHQWREHGVVLLRGVFPTDILTPFKMAADACLPDNKAPLAREPAPGRLSAYRFTPFSHSVLLTALLDFGIASREQLLAPLTVEALRDLLPDALDEPVSCNLEHSWVRKRFAPGNAPPLYRPNTWHQDGGLGVAFTTDPASVPAMTHLLTCWIPLQACGTDAPGLELVRHRLDGLLHYTELDDHLLRQRFPPDEFRAPELEFGDGLLILPGTLHRTHVRPEMHQDRLSLEYRLFPARRPA
jgi:hypothetical protein